MTNLERVQHMYTRAADDPSELTAILDDDVIWEFNASAIPEMGNCRGPVAVLDFFRRWTGAFTDWGFECEELIETGDTVIGHIHQWGIGKGSGARVDDAFWQVWRFRDGKAIYVTHHTEREDALRAAA
jgi:ketosteroid isomerase-like protein